MNPTTRPETRTSGTRRRRRAVALPIAMAVIVGLAGCGDDEDDADDADVTTTATAAPATTEASDEPATTEPETTEPQTTEPQTTEPQTAEPDTAEGASAEFCDAFLGVEAAFRDAPQDPEAMAEYAETEIMPLVETLRANLPAEVADEVTVLTDAAEAAAGGDFSGFESPAFFEAQSVIYPWLGEGCGLPVVEVAAVDYAFGGVPAALEPGPTIFTLVNESEAGEAHEMGFARVNDGVELTVDELLALPMEEVEQYVSIGGGVFAPAGASGSSIVDLSEGRWVYVCFIPVGSVDGQEGSGPPHFMEGMVGELIVG